jgi:AsmA protein
VRILRIAAIGVGVLVALLVIAVIALFLFVDPNKYRGDIERIAKQHTGRDLTIGGKLELKVFPWIALSVHDVQLSNRAGFGKEPFMAVQNASIGVKVWPLLAKRLEVSKISLDGVVINLDSRGEENNWKDLGESGKAPPEPTPQESTSSTSLSIEGVELSKSSLVYRDEVKKSSTEISNLELHTGRLETGPARTAIGSLELKGTYLSRPTGTQSAPTATELKPLAFGLSTSGLVLDTAAHTLAPAKVDLTFGDSTVALAVSGQNASTDDRLMTGSLVIAKTAARQLLLSLGIEPPITRDTQALSTLAMQTQFRLTKKQLQLSALQLTLDDTHVTGSVSVDDLDTDALGFDLSVDAINLDRYRAPELKTAAKSGPTPAKPAAPPTPLPLESLRKLNVHGNLKIGSATVSNLLFTNLVVPLIAKDGHIRLGPTQARLYGGTCTGDIVLDAAATTADLSLNEHVLGTDIGALLKAAADSTRLSGHADMNVALKGTGNTDAALMQSLSGKIDANVKQGALNGIDVVYELQRVNALLKKQVPSQRTGPTRTVFNTLQTSATLDKQMLHVDDMKMETDFLKIHGGGTLNTVTEAINYQLVASVNKLQPNGSPAGGAGGGLDALNSVDIPLDITGTLSSPTVRPDLAALAKGKLGQEVQQRAGDLVKKKLGDKLQGLFGK